MRKLGKYEVLGELGHGAMGVVYRARDPIINRMVALKTITTGLADDPNLLQRFYREAQSAGGLQHPNIVTIYDMGEDQNLPYIAMELIEGESLEPLIARRTTVPLALKLTYALQACRAFDYAHKRGIVHRDIKPGNVMVSKDGVVKVVDFGIARVLDTSKTQTGMLIGTFAYMSPEQYHGEHADERSDIWSFGVLLYELLCYQRPFTGENPASLMHSICSQEPRSLTERVPDCPPALEGILAKILRKSREDRFQSMEDLLLELEPVYKELQARSITELIDQSRALIDKSEFAQARDLLRESLKVDSANTQARTLLEKVNTELKRLLIRPKAQQHVDKGRALLEEGRIQEARTEAENALQLDSTFEQAQELEEQVKREIDRAQTVAEWLQAAGQRLAEGVPEEAETLLAKVLQLEPANKQAKDLERQVLAEKEERQRRLLLLERMQEARGLWTQLNYEGCIGLLNELQREFPGEEEVQRLLDTVREDQAEQHRQKTLEGARNLLAVGNYAESRALLLNLQKQFPADEEIPRLLEEIRLDDAKHRRNQGLAEARSYLANRQYDESIATLTALQEEFREDREISQLIQAAREDQREQQRQQGLAEARNLLAARRYDQCSELAAKLKKRFPNDKEIADLQRAIREDQTEQRRQEGLTKARNLLAARHHDESISALTDLAKEFPADEEIARLVKIARVEQAQQQRQNGIAEARSLRAAGRHDECDAVLTKLQKQFSGDSEILELQKANRNDQAQQQRQQGVAEARELLAARHYDQCKALLAKLQKQFPQDAEILDLQKAVLDDQAQQQKQQDIAEARALLASGRYDNCNALLAKLQKQFPDDSDILKLQKSLAQDQAEERKTGNLTKARTLLAAKNYVESVPLLAGMSGEYPDDQEVAGLLATARKDQAEQQRQQGVEEVRSLLSSRRYEECAALLAKLKKQFPADPEILQLQSAVTEEEADQRKQESLAKARNLLAKRNYDESIGLLNALATEFPNDLEVPKLLATAREGLAEQRKLKSLAEARNLLAGRNYAESVLLLTELNDEFPDDRDIPRLLANALKEQTEQQKQQKLAEARALLAAQRFSEALELLDGLGGLHPKDNAVKKLRVLVEREREKQSRTEGLQRELESLKKLVSERKYSELLIRAEPLREEFPTNGDLLRLVDFARNQQAQIDGEKRLRTALEEVKSQIRASRFTDAIRSAQAGLKDFPGNGELVYLREQAEGQEKKQRARGMIEQRIREIKFKINRQDLSEAIDLAKQTIAITGPEAELTRLLNSAVVEFEAREKKRQQEQKIQEIRTMMESGNVDGASETLHDALETEALNPFDSRVNRMSHEIDAAKAPPNVTPSTAAPSAPANFSKEYAFLQGRPLDDAPPPIDAAGVPEAAMPQASAAHPSISSEPTAPMLPQRLESIALPAATPDVVRPSKQKQAPVPADPKRPAAPASAPGRTGEIETRTETEAAPREFKKTALLAAIAVGLVLGVWATAHFVSSPKTEAPGVAIERPKSAPSGANPGTAPVVPAKPAANPVEAQQRSALALSDKLTASGDLKGALRALQGAENLSGPLSAEIKSKELTVNESMKNASLASLRQQEAALWQQATAEMDKAEFDAAKRDFRKIVASGDGGVRKADAQRYLNDLIPRRQKEEDVFRKAQQESGTRDPQGLQRAAELFGQVAAMNGPRKTEAEELQRNANAKLAGLNQENAGLQVATLEAAARLNIQQGDLNSARQKAEQVRQAGGDSAALLKEIDQAQASQARASQQQREFQQAVQAYDGLGSRDKSGLEKSRGDFQAIVRENGPQTADAQQYLTDINRKLDALNQPAPPPPPAVKTEPPNTAAADERAIRDVVQRFISAFEQRNPEGINQVWPTIPARTYAGYKSSFDKASAIQMQVLGETVKINPDGVTATVSAQLAQQYSPKGQKTMARTDSWAFQLARINGTWAITDVR